VQDLVGLASQPADRLIDDVLGAIEVDVPIASMGQLGENLAIHDGVGPGLVGDATLDGDVGGEVERPFPQRDRRDRLGKRGRDLVKRSGRGPNDRRPHLGDERDRGGEVEVPALVVDRRR
jgi:hypothetical protein